MFLDDSLRHVLLAKKEIVHGNMQLDERVRLDFPALENETREALTRGVDAWDRERSARSFEGGSVSFPNAGAPSPSPGYDLEELKVWSNYELSKSRIHFAVSMVEILKGNPQSGFLLYPIDLQLSPIQQRWCLLTVVSQRIKLFGFALICRRHPRSFLDEDKFAQNSGAGSTIPIPRIADHWASLSWEAHWAWDCQWLIGYQRVKTVI